MTATVRGVQAAKYAIGHLDSSARRPTNLLAAWLTVAVTWDYALESRPGGHPLRLDAWTRESQGTNCPADQIRN